MPKIVALDAATLAITPAQWDSLRTFGDCAFYPLTPHDDVNLIAERSAGADILIINKVPMTAALFEKTPSLRCICVSATGYNVVDTAAARAAGIDVCNVPAYGTASVAQHAVAFLLFLTNHIAHYDASVRAGEWIRSEKYWYKLESIGELAGKTAGIVGFGAIGRTVADILHALGMRILASARTRRDAPAWPDFAWASTDDIFQKADVVSLHCPQTPATAGLVNAARLASMKPGSLLINTARGGLIDEPALARALKHGPLAGAGLDVLSAEPMRADCPLFNLPNCVMTPHVAWASEEAMLRLFAIIRENIKAFLAGTPCNVVNPQ